jgi:hypothetical protein
VGALLVCKRRDDRERPIVIAPEVVLRRKATLADALDQVLNRGAVVVGEARIGLADIDLIYVGLQLVLGSTEAVGEVAGGSHWALPDRAPNRPEELDRGPRRLGAPEVGIGGAVKAPPAQSHRSTVQTVAGRLPGFEDLLEPAAQPDVASPDASSLVQLVMTLVELLRQLVERQAVHRMEGGRLSDEEVERMGCALLDLDARMTELREAFGLTPEDLNLNLGPLGGLLQ